MSTMMTCAVCSEADHAALKASPERIACECIFIGIQSAYEDIPAMRLYNHTCMSTIAIVIKEAA